MINVLVVDDSNTVRQLLCFMINSHKDMKVIGEASNGEEAIKLAKKLKPSLITMDINMPVKSGIKAIREIMSTQACPIIIVSEYWSQNEKNDVFQALQMGALGVVNKPRGPSHPNFEKDSQLLLKQISLLSEIKVVTRKPNPKPSPSPLTNPSISNSKLSSSVNLSSEAKLVLIGASTGGPVVIKTILEKLPKPYSLPILIVQHISYGFLQGLVHWLSNTTGHEVVIAINGERPKPGKVYFAPDDFQMGISPSGEIRLSKDPHEFGLRPCVSYFFRSSLRYHPSTLIAILLTGMGVDGAKELCELKENGATTLIQNEASCIVFGMPGEAFRMGGYSFSLSPPQIAEFLSKANQDSPT